MIPGARDMPGGHRQGRGGGGDVEFESGAICTFKLYIPPLVVTPRHVLTPGIIRNYLNFSVYLSVIYCYWLTNGPN